MFMASTLLRGAWGKIPPTNRAIRAARLRSKKYKQSNLHFRHSRKCVGSGTASRRGCRAAEALPGFGAEPQLSQKRLRGT